LFLFGVNFYFEGSLDGSCNKSRENAAPGFLFTKLNTSGTFSLPKLSCTVLLFAEEEEEEEEDLEEDDLF